MAHKLVNSVIIPGTLWAQPPVQMMHPYSRSILDTCKDCFPANLPAGLLPECSVYHDVHLKDNADAPHRAQEQFKRLSSTVCEKG